MDVRCTGCNKLFRVSDEKIVGSGVKFSCTRCHETVKITKDDFEQYKLANEPNVLLASAALKSTQTAAAPSRAEAAPVPPAPAPPVEPPSGEVPSYLFEEPTATSAADFSASSGDSSLFDLSDPATAAAALSRQAQEGDREGEIPDLFSEPPQQPVPGPVAGEETKPGEPQKEQTAPKAESVAATVFPKPEPPVPPKAEPRPGLKPAPGAAPKVKPGQAQKPAPAAAVKAEAKPAPPVKEEAKAAPKPKAEPLRPAEAGEAAVPSLPVEIEEDRMPAVFDAAPADAPSGFGKKALVLAAVVLLIGAAVFGIMTYMGKESGQAPQPASAIQSPEGLQILNPSGSFDSAKGDLVITGTVQNTTDKPKPAWYLVVDVYDAQNAVIARARLLSGKQLYTSRDLDILIKRGAAIQDLKMKSMDQGTTIPPKGSVNFEIRILEAPAGIASFNPVLQPFDPVQLFKELAEEQK